MDRRRHIQRMLGLALVVCVVGSTSGCSKWLANFHLKQATKRVEEARTHEAERFALQQLNTTTDLINTTTDQINSELFKDARTTGKQAGAAAKELVEVTKQARTNFLRSEANRWMGILRTNNSTAIDPTLHQQIEESNALGQEAADDQKWDDAIENFDKAVTDAQFLLENLKRDAEQGLKEVAGLKEALLEEGAEEHNPEAIFNIDKFHADIEEFIVDKLDYQTALRMRIQAGQEAEEGIQRTKEVKSDKELRKIETLLGEAVDIGAEIYAPRSLENVTREFEELLTQFLGRKYDSVLAAAPDLEPEARNLIVETQRESARSKIEDVEQAIAGLIEGQAKIYLPGRVEQLEDMLADARGRFDANAYVDTEQVALKALEEKRKIIDEFDTLAQTKIGVGSGRLTIGESVFTRMQEIFAKSVSPGEMTEDERALEDGKQALREELGAMIRDAKLRLGLATLKKDDKVFHEAIEIAEQVVVQADQIANETYHVVAHNSIQEISNQLTRYERDGGREHAAAELNKTEAMLLDARQKVTEGEYRQAVEQSASAHAQLEILAQELERVAVGKIQEANDSIAAAERLGADRFELNRLQEAKEIIGIARKQLELDRIKPSIDEAIRAADLAGRSGAAAIQEWATEEMLAADALIARCYESGTQNYAPDLLDEAVNLRRNATTLFDSGNMVEAQEIASQANRIAHDALYAQVDLADDEIATTRRYEGWDYQYKRLSEAIVSAKYAREYLDQANYPLSHSHAREAITKARRAGIESRQAAFKDRVNGLKAKVDTAAAKGPGYFQPGALSELVGAIRQIQTEFRPQGFERASEEMELIDARLEGLLSSTPDRLGEIVEEMNDRLTILEGRGAANHTPDLVAEVSRRLKLAQIDFRNEHYRASYQNVRDGVSVLAEMELKLDERDYDRQMGGIFTEFSEVIRGFAPVLNIGSSVLIQLTQGPTGRSQALAVVNATDPAEFRQAIGALALKIDQMEIPSTRESVHQASRDMIAEAKRGADGFEKLLILDQYSMKDARKIITSAFLDIRSARNEQQEIQKRLENPTTSNALVGVKRLLQARP